MWTSIISSVRKLILTIIIVATMKSEVWINLPVKDIHKSEEFFTKIGFFIRHHKGDGDLAGMLINDSSVAVMLFDETSFKELSQNCITDTVKSTEVVISFDVTTREEVNQVASVVKNAGGHLYRGPVEYNGWMYGFWFRDLDDHRWNVVYKDKSKMPG